MLTPQQVLSKWTQNTTAAGPSYAAGVQAVTTAPGQTAAANAQNWLNGCNSSLAKYKTNVAAVSLQSWQQSCVQKGQQRIAAGVQAAQSKMGNFFTQLLPQTAAVKAAVASMPKGTLQDGIARATKAITMMAAWKPITTTG